MTFNFTPSNDQPTRRSALTPARTPRLVTDAPTTEGPTIPQLATLVRELFHEGCLSWQQLCALATLPELGPLLAEAIADAPAGRKPLAAE